MPCRPYPVSPNLPRAVLSYFCPRAATPSHEGELFLFVRVRKTMKRLTRTFHGIYNTENGLFRSEHSDGLRKWLMGLFLFVILRLM